MPDYYVVGVPSVCACRPTIHNLINGLTTNLHIKCLGVYFDVVGELADTLRRAQNSAWTGDQVVNEWPHVHHDETILSNTSGVRV
jgi:hypothetical protein